MVLLEFFGALLAPESRDGRGQLVDAAAQEARGGVPGDGGDVRGQGAGGGAGAEAQEQGERLLGQLHGRGAAVEGTTEAPGGDPGFDLVAADFVWCLSSSKGQSRV
ncbi:hypothetical protein Tdes44962_MAKER10363 [Teratosphaeria destructans]|uniref:Uncharacterized protein n=1 Tax=Teratosphaeria destructans TaxID=418781 RepID=A0A9W7VZ47_9PEZI|nr:hypothetical protein Tdes44962_MAKER10363 [Teratosphaeria destructans]